MKRISIIICAMLMLVLACLSACGLNAPSYVPTGEFYKKTSPAIGDGGATDVIDLEAEYLTYQGTGDITVPMTLGFGHWPTNSEYEADPNASFSVHITVHGFPVKKDQPAWELTLDYQEDWYSKKFDSTEPEESHPFLFIPHYGDFYPLYKENVEIVFPEGLESGVLYITITLVEGERTTGMHCDELCVGFYREGDILTLESE